MDQIACPVCTLYLREGMTLQSHLNTHPKSQVIDALVRNIVVKGNEIVRVNPPPAVSQNVVPIVVPQQQVTSITYQQFLSSTSFVNSPIIPPASPSQLPRQTNQSINQYQQYPNQEAAENDYNAVYPLQRPYSAHQYTELQNYNPQSKTIDNIRPFISEPNLDNSSYNGSFARHNSREILNQDHNVQFTSSDLASVITDSHRVISNSPPSLYNSYNNDLNKPSQHVISNCVPSSYNSFSNDINKSNLCVISNSSSNAYNSFSDDLNKSNWEETGGSVNNDEARSPTASLSSVCSVRVRKDLGDNNVHEDNTLVQLSSPQCEEYIIPGFDYRDDDDDDDNHAEPDHLEENSPNSIPLNIHTDESMPPRGELSGQGTNSSVWQVHNENVSNFGMLREDRWRKEVFEEPVEVHKCSECNKIFSSLQEWRMHASLYHQQPVITESTPPVEILPSRPESFGCVFVKSEKVRVIEEIKSVKNEIKDSKDSITKICRKPPRTCTTCSLTFACGEEFRNHIKKIHPLECTICGKCFLRNSGLTLHQKRHLKIKPYKCDLCDKSFITNQKLNEHKTVHTGEKPIKCPDCPQKFKRHSNLIQHRQYVHLKIKKKVKDFYCYCGEVFHTKSKLLWHQEIHNPKPKQCMCCKERFIHSASLTRHIRRMHDQTYLSKTKSEPGENVECTHCHKTVLKSSLRYHMLIHDGIKPHPCSTCGKRFLSRWNMKLHEWTHAARASKPHKCKLCKAAFFRLNEFEVHMRSHKNIRPYSCNHCGKQFSHKYNCMRHTREHEEVKMYRCEECGKEFHRNYYLKDHMKVHTGVRPYTCHICAKSSASKTNHNKHLKTHHAREQVTSEN